MGVTESGGNRSGSKLETAWKVAEFDQQLLEVEPKEGLAKVALA